MEFIGRRLSEHTIKRQNVRKNLTEIAPEDKGNLTHHNCEHVKHPTFQNGI